MKLTIEKMIYGGEGLAHLPADAFGRGKALFVPFVLPGEEIEAEITEEKPGFARATAKSILTTSSQRAGPPCPYFLDCGGCHYQHTSYANQLDIKSEILRETLLRTARIDWKGKIDIHAAEPWNYRNRTRLKVRREPFALGYYRFNSHELLPVRECPISSLLTNRAIAAIWDLKNAHAIWNGVNEVELFADAEDRKLLLEAYLAGSGDAALLENSAARLFGSLTPQLAELAGVAAFFKNAPSAAFGYEGADFLQYRTRVAQFRVSAGSFFQVNRFLIDDLVAAATAEASGHTAWDLYAGVGLFSAALAKSFERVVAVESSPASSDDLTYNAARSVKPERCTTERFLSDTLQQKKRQQPDFVLVDPPRAGLGQKVAKQLASAVAPNISYVSCDPSTLARDLRILLDSGYTLDELHLIDLFPQTFHIEAIARLSR